MKEVQVINFNDGNCLIIKFYDEEVCFDSLVQIVFHLGKEEYVLLDDILGYALEELKEPLMHIYDDVAVRLLANCMDR